MASTNQTLNSILMTSFFNENSKIILLSEYDAMTVLKKLQPDLIVYWLSRAPHTRKVLSSILSEINFL